MVLTEEQRKRIQTSFESGKFDLESEVEYLVSQGFSREQAVASIRAEADAFRQMLFNRRVQKEKGDDHGKIALFVVIMIGLAGPVFNIASLLWYIVACIIAAGVGYWAYKDKPLAGSLGYCCFVILAPITYYWYISGRSSIIRLELLIPMALAMIPSFLVGLLISTLFYSNK